MSTTQRKLQALVGLTLAEVAILLFARAKGGRSCQEKQRGKERGGSRTDSTRRTTRDQRTHIQHLRASSDSLQGPVRRAESVDQSPNANMVRVPTSVCKRRRSQLEIEDGEGRRGASPVALDTFFSAGTNEASTDGVALGSIILGEADEAAERTAKSELIEERGVSTGEGGEDLMAKEAEEPMPETADASEDEVAVDEVVAD
jgi:hypothetical protein